MRRLLFLFLTLLAQPTGADWIGPCLERRLVMTSWYDNTSSGPVTASGARFDERKLTAAHRTLPFGAIVRVTNPRNDRAVVVTINDRGPYVRGRQLDLSRAAADRIGIRRQGVARVWIEVLTT